MRIPGGTLLKLLDYKVKFPSKIGGTCYPLGVITRDLRKTDEVRVYTQYIFLMVLNLPNATTIKKLESIVASFTPLTGSPVSPCLKKVLTRKFFLSGESARTMDWLAYRAQRGGKQEKMKCVDSRFVRGFDIL